MLVNNIFKKILDIFFVRLEIVYYFEHTLHTNDQILIEYGLILKITSP